MSEEVSPNHVGSLNMGIESYGNWNTEMESVAFIKDILKRSELFKIYNEIRGRNIQPRPFCEDKDMRIDFILSPTTQLVQAGWKGGPIGLECKKSGVKLNEPLAQVHDYTHTIWLLPATGYMFMCQYHFIWPFHKVHGFYASTMAQNRIGTCSYDENRFRKELRFFCGENKVIKYDLDSKRVEVGKCDFGFKAGSR